MDFVLYLFYLVFIFKYGSYFSRSPEELLEWAILRPNVVILLLLYFSFWHCLKLKNKEFFLFWFVFEVEFFLNFKVGGCET